MLFPFFGFGRFKKGSLSFDPAFSTPRIQKSLFYAEFRIYRKTFTLFLENLIVVKQEMIR